MARLPAAARSPLQGPAAAIQDDGLQAIILQEGLGGGVPFVERHTHRAGSVSRIKCRPIAHIEIPQRAERTQVADIDKGIVWHRRPLS
jgi:hypothetical protein